MTSSSQTLKDLKGQISTEIEKGEFPSPAEIFECVECEDIGWVRAEIGGVKRCECRIQKIRTQRQAEAVSLTPTLYRDKFGIIHGLESIKPDPKIHERQPETLETLKAHPEMSYMLWGKTGTHKTAMSWALVQEAGKRGRKVAGASGRTIADTLRQYAMGQLEQRPSFYSIEQLRTDDRFTLLIDEIELFPVTEYSLTMLFELVDAVQTYDQQLIITSNRDMRGLLTRWVSADKDGKAYAVDYAEKILRRLAETCAVIDLS